ncbi:MAG: acetate--CoA ligase family protein [Deltaproteobacteria bacterium]|nr:acetate--CoA ligase family protein [Deltaproteobacteria bacterium]
MARLFEHQGKRLLAQQSLAVPKSKLVSTSAEALAAARELGCPVVLKIQTLTGRRGKSGGVLFANGPEEAGEKAEILFKALPPGGSVLVEEKARIESEFYVAVTADPSARMPVVLLSGHGGIDVEEINRSESLLTRRVDILKGLSLEEAVEFASQLSQLGRERTASLGQVIHSLYRLYRSYDCKLVEVNPLALCGDRFLALDARVDIDDDALYRHKDLGLEIVEESGDRPPTLLEIAAGKIDENDHRGSAHFTQIDPDGSYVRSIGKIPIGFDCVGTGVSLTLLDELAPLGYYPVNFCDTSGSPPASKLYRITKIIFSQPAIKGYIFGTCVATQRLDENVRGILKAWMELYPKTNGEPNIPCLFLLRGAYSNSAIEVLKKTGIYNSRWIRVLGTDATERDAAREFDLLYCDWEMERKRVGL